MRFVLLASLAFTASCAITDKTAGESVDTDLPSGTEGDVTAPMPAPPDPLTETVDTAAVSMICAWITSL